MKQGGDDSLLQDNMKVSVITPLFNCEKYIQETILSVIAQTYSNWEMILVDDCSSDSTRIVVETISSKDSRIKLIALHQNSGAAVARNTALENVSGRFVAYLDADDIWLPNKLERQVQFMIEKECGFSCTSYELIDDAGNLLHKSIHMLERCDYEGFLTNNLLQTVGIMVDLKRIDKNLLKMPNIRRRQDAATWLQILKSGNDCYGLDEVLTQYRRTNKSLSSNKLKAARGMWRLYRDIEHLPFVYSVYCFVRYAVLAVWKRIYI